jgi:hypothetical protein
VESNPPPLGPVGRSRTRPTSGFPLSDRTVFEGILGAYNAPLQTYGVTVQQDAAGVWGVPRSPYSSPMSGGSKGVEGDIETPSGISPFLKAKNARMSEKVVNKHNLGIEL